MIQRIAVAMLLLQAGAAAQSTSSDDLEAGKLLVASRDLSDPNFAKTVILLVHYDENGVVGLIVNRQTDVPLFRVLPPPRRLRLLPPSSAPRLPPLPPPAPNLDQVKGRSGPMYAGGPVERRAMLALIRTRSKSDDSEPVAGEIRLISDKSLLEKRIAQGTDASAFHVYARPIRRRRRRRRRRRKRERVGARSSSMGQWMPEPGSSSPAMPRWCLTPARNPCGPV